MLHLKNLSDKFQKRLIRPEYAQTQATPYDVTLDPSLRNTDGSVRIPKSTDTSGATPSGAAAAAPFTRSADAYSLKNGLIPGLVLTLSTAEFVAVATGANSALQPFGLLANFVGGNIDDIGDENKVGCWRGPDSTYTLLAPAFNDSGGDGTSLATAYAAAANTGQPVKLYAGTDGRLTNYTTPGNRIVVAHLIDRPGASRITIDLKI